MRANALFDAHRADPEFGYRLLVEEARITGEPMVERTAWRICSAQGWWSAFGKKRGKNGKVGPPVHDDLVERDSPPRHQISCGWLILPSIRPQRARFSVCGQRRILQPHRRLLAWTHR